MSVRLSRVALWCEFTILFVAVPVWLWFDRLHFGQRIIPTLVVISVLCLVVLLRDRSFDRSRLWNRGNFGRHLRATLKRLLIGTVVLGAFTAVFEPALFLRFPRESPRMWAMVMVFYPVFSVYPQELIFRTFLFHRYRPLFGSTRNLVIVSAIAFGLAHVFFANLLAPLLSTVGGWVFARTYARSASTLQATIEHGLWGDVLFTVGLGWYFYGGSIGG
ncbi:MAG: CPBP family intramembrane metalloprotease [marine benthic group bacterium]|nr:CPBP family intramembrane metalloprotease [Gemmatimonadota bacterium]